MAHWYIRIRDVETEGPVTTEFLRNFLSQHQDADIHVWREGLGDFMPARDVAELRTAPASAELKPSFPGAAEPAPPPARDMNVMPPLVAEARNIALRSTQLENEELPGDEISDPANPISRKRRWAKIGAIIALVLAILKILADGDSVQISFAFMVGRLAGAAALGGLVGFIVGACGDGLFYVRENDPLLQLQPQPEQKSQLARYNFIARHWRGELKLWVSYWVIGIFAGLILFLVQAAFLSLFKMSNGFEPIAIFLAISGSLIFGTAISVWEWVGTWRSARAYTQARLNAGRHATWGGLAQISIFLAVIAATASTVRETMSEVSTVFPIVFQGDPDLEDYSIRTMRDGTEVEISGGIKYGLAKDLEKTLVKSGRVKVIHLHSDGGRLLAGIQLYEVIRKHDLTTYVSTECASACAVAFSGGHERILHRDAKLGFHRGSVSQRDGVQDSKQADIFKAAGFSEDFIAKATTTPHTSMWNPSLDVLRKANVITKSADGSEFAASGYGPDVSKQAIARYLARQPILNAFQHRFPKPFEEIATAYHEAIVSGQSKADVENIMAKAYRPYSLAFMRLAADDVVISAGRLYAAQYRFLQAINPSYCFELAGGKDFSSLFSRELIQESNYVQLKSILTAEQWREDISETMFTESWDRLLKVMVSRGVSKDMISGLSDDNVPASQHADYCRTSIMLYSELDRLRPGDATLVMRSILNGKSIINRPSRGWHAPSARLIPSDKSAH